MCRLRNKQNKNKQTRKQTEYGMRIIDKKTGSVKKKKENKQNYE